MKVDSGLLKNCTFKVSQWYERAKRIPDPETECATKLIPVKEGLIIFTDEESGRIVEFKFDQELQIYNVCFFNFRGIVNYDSQSCEAFVADLLRYKQWYKRDAKC
jgi:hypothetical protein